MSKEQTDIYIKSKMEEFASNISEFEIDQTITDVANNCKCVILNKTINSIEVRHFKKTKLGIDCSQWYSMIGFSRRFKK